MLRFLVIVIVGILFFRILFRIVIPWLLKRKINKMQDEYHQQQQGPRDEKKSEGEVTIKNIPENRKTGNKKKKDRHEDEDFADYEEIDED
ncbi:MAG: DUF4834 family protein [Bacteroidota bacterium]